MRSRFPKLIDWLGKALKLALRIGFKIIFFGRKNGSRR